MFVRKQSRWNSETVVRNGSFREARFRRYSAIACAACGSDGRFSTAKPVPRKEENGRATSKTREMKCSTCRGRSGR